MTAALQQSIISRPELLSSIFQRFIFNDFVKSRNKTAKKKDPDARRANLEE
jgi:hypothetical protein